MAVVLLYLASQAALAAPAPQAGKHPRLPAGYCSATSLPELSHCGNVGQGQAGDRSYCQYSQWGLSPIRTQPESLTRQKLWRNTPNSMRLVMKSQLFAKLCLLHYFKGPEVSVIENSKASRGLGISCGCGPRTGRARSWELSQRGNTSAHFHSTDEMNLALHPRASSVASIRAKCWSGCDMNCWGAGNWSATCHLF